MQQAYPYFNRRSKRRQNEYFQTYPFYEHQPIGYQNPQFMNPMYTRPPEFSYHQTGYQQPYGSGSYNGNVENSFINQPYPTPYPKPMPYFKQPQPSGFQNVISQFKKSDGQLDFNKMMDTAGQMMNAVNQMGGLFKGVTSMFK
ncbi:YppG family protein [Metabacillus schmidteae]|uniref:YppG family protein n=1 Tax=Metabacillus schmidteae TaxID=2730405 RepID=UPI0015899EB3|nr:YppG family protein [Metabacillus schmidteae]